jgi:hypothetical protein
LVEANFLARSGCHSRAARPSEFTDKVGLIIGESKTLKVLLNAAVFQEVDL